MSGMVTSTANQEQALQQGLQGLNQQETRLAKALEDLLAWLGKLGDAQSLEGENLTEQQLAERAQFRYEQEKARLTAEIMKTPQGQLGVAAGDAVSGSISGSLSGAMQALLNGGDVKQAVASALAQAGQGLMQSTLDALLNPLLAQIQNGLFKAITGVDVEAAALKAAASTQMQAGGTLIQAGTTLIAAGAALGGGGGGGDTSKWFSLAMKIPSLISGFSGLGGVPDFSGAFGSASPVGFGDAMGMNLGFSGLSLAPNLTSAFTPGLAGGGEVQYGLDYLVGEKNAEIVRFNKDGGRIYSNRALTQALGVPFQRTPGGGAAVADGGGGESLGIPFMGGSTPRAAGDRLEMPFMGGNTPRAAGGGGDRLGIPFLKTTGGNGGVPGASGGAGAGPAAMLRSAPIRLSVESQVINGVEYATIEQLREASAAAAQAGRDSAYDGMQNNPSIQRMLGLR